MKARLKGWRPAYVQVKHALPRHGEGFENVVISGVVFYNNRRVFVERLFPRGRGDHGSLRLWGHGKRYGFELTRRLGRARP